ncbi:tail fiber domain-containing protein [Leclercia sp. H6W5]|uniref:tail fiber/spike domain-containing protein n=1 Tax=Leclercia tamurae TaxID=2926467 RepID=UPI0021CDECBD|nr:tail fiber domain-containing protein [Leclercia tamurae]MCU6682125.1 tail fiber domain-containing protein [Leclercia tamurae]
MAKTYLNIPVPTPTRNPVPSADIRDHVFGGAKIDEFATSTVHTYTDRFGVQHWTIAGIQYTATQVILSLGFITMDSFQAGATLTLPNQVLRDTSTGEYYRWDGVFPKVVPSGSTPGTAGGVSLGAWLSVGDATLRGELSVQGGSGLIGGLTKPVTWAGFSGGADESGVADSSAAFQAAVTQTDGLNINSAIYDGVPDGKYITLRVPTGSYKLASKISPKGKHVVWLLDAGVKIDNPDNLCGRVIQAGVRSNGDTAGSLDGATAHSFSLHRGKGKPPAVQGITSPSDLATVTERDAVTVYVDIENPIPTVTAGSATYSSNQAFPAASIDVSQLIPGMIVDTMDGYAGVLLSWAPDGASITVKDGWYKGSTTPGTPTSSGFVINAITKVWAHNANVVLTPTGYASRAAGFEMGLRNTKFNPTNPADKDNYMWGFDVVGFGPYPGSVAYMQRPGVLRGFESSGAQKDGFVVTARGGIAPITAFATECNSFEQISLKPDGTNSVFKVTNAGDIDIGGQAYPGNRTIRLRSSQLNNDYDVRLSAVGGAATPGQGVYRIVAASVEFDGNISPVTANTRLCGTSAKPWSGGFTQTAFTVTSGEQTKTRPLEITDELMDAWSEVGFSQYQYVDRVIEKGDDGARWHFGFIAERAKEAFARHNLDAHRFAFFCYNEWEDQYIDVQINEGETIKQTVYLEQFVMVEGTDTPVTKRVFFVNEDGSPAIDEEGKPRYADEPVIETVEREIEVPAPPVYEKQLETPAGKRYGVRYEEALILECALQRRNYQRLLAQQENLAARIEALEVGSHG